MNCNQRGELVRKWLVVSKRIIPRSDTAVRPHIISSDSDNPVVAGQPCDSAPSGELGRGADNIAEQSAWGPEIDLR